MKFIEYLLYHWDKLVGNPNLDNGFIEKKPHKKDYVHSVDKKDGEYGFISKKVLVPDGQWDKFRSKGERQKREARETMACVTFSAMNDLEKHGNFHLQNDSDESREIANILRQFNLVDENGECNFSDRHIAKLSGTSVRGNSQSNVAKAIKDYGLVPENMWAWDTNNYYATVPQSVIDKGKELLEYLEFKYEWVDPKNFNALNVFGPIQTSMYYMPPRSIGGIYQRTGLRRNHAIDQYGYVMGEYDKIDNSYPPFMEKTAWNFDLGMGMLFTIKLKKKLPNPVDKFVEDYDGKNVKHKDSPAIWFIQQGKKKLYPSWLTYLAYNGLDRGYSMVDSSLIEATPDGDEMDVTKSRYWEFLENVKKGNQIDLLLEILMEKK